MCSGFPHYGIDWSGCDLVEANLTKASLTGANLTGANLFGAILIGARLTNATGPLSSADGVTWSNTICPDGTNSNSNQFGTCAGHPMGW